MQAESTPKSMHTLSSGQSFLSQSKRVQYPSGTDVSQTSASRAAQSEFVVHESPISGAQPDETSMLTSNTPSRYRIDLLVFGIN